MCPCKGYRRYHNGCTDNQLIVCVALCGRGVPHWSLRGSGDSAAPTGEGIGLTTARSSGHLADQQEAKSFHEYRNLHKACSQNPNTKHRELFHKVGRFRAVPERFRGLVHCPTSILKLDAGGCCTPFPLAG